MQLCDVTIDDDGWLIILPIGGFSSLYFRDVRFQASAVRQLRTLEEARVVPPYFRLMRFGASIMTSRVGIYGLRKPRELWLVNKRSDAIVVDLDDPGFRRLVLSVDDPLGTIARLARDCPRLRG